MSKNIEFSKCLENVLLDIDDNLTQKYRKGIEQNLILFIKDRYPAALSQIGEKCLVDEELLGDDFRNQYFKKSTQDYSAKDFAISVLKHPGIPPEGMSVDSLEKKIRELFDSPKYIEKVYIKRVQGGKNVACLNYMLTQEITCNKAVLDLVQKQISKAEKNLKDTIEWKQYEHERAYINYLDELSEKYAQGANEQSNISTLFQCDEIYYMVKALFSLFFTDYDFDLLSQDEEERDALIMAKDFGERYQYFDNLRNSPHYDWRYYKRKSEKILFRCSCRKSSRYRSKTNQSKRKLMKLSFFMFFPSFSL